MRAIAAILAVAASGACVGARATGAAPAPDLSNSPRGIAAAVRPPIARPAGAVRPPITRPPAAPSPELRVRLRPHPAPWSDALDAVIGDRPASASVAIDGRLVFSHLGDVLRIPASNEKLLLSMALLDRYGPRARIPTTLETVRPVRGGVIRGNLWLVGHGDPDAGDGTLERLAEELAQEGVRRVRGSVVGDTSAFRRERRAQGWHRIALSYVSIPTALVFDANAGPGGFVFDPEREAATALTSDLRSLGVEVDGRPRAAGAPDAARPIARVRSAPLVRILRRQNTGSINLDAEVLGKRLGAATYGGRGSIAKGARAIERWAAWSGVEVTAHDASGLSYANRVTTDGLVRLLAAADRQPWGRALRSTLPSPGVGTLAGRLAGVDVRAKTGTLIGGVSALSGWVRLRDGRLAAFSILSRGMSKDAAVALEDAVVRFLAERVG